MSEIVKQETGLKLSADVLSSVVLNGDVSKLSPKEKVDYYIQLCNRVGIDPATQPFKLLRLNGKEIFYADKGATQQLSQLHNISHEIVKRERFDDVYVVTVRAKDGNGRYTDEDGAVTIGGLSKDNLANALMKATTKAKRRAVLALTGLGMLDETEVETIPNAERVDIPSVQDAVVVETPKEEPKPEKKKRSDWYYQFRDSILVAENVQSLDSIQSAIIQHKSELSQDELADLRTAYKKQNNKLVAKG